MAAAEGLRYPVIVKANTGGSGKGIARFDTKTELAAKMNDVGAVLPGKTVKLDFGDQGTIMLDGVGNKVSEDDGAADTTIKIAWDDWQAMADGQLDGMTAFMTGKLKVEGDMSNAMQLQGVLSKLTG